MDIDDGSMNYEALHGEVNYGVGGVVVEVFPPFLVAGLGMVAAGLLLAEVHLWPVFIEVRELLILVPALLGLKGNLEMTLASRISTHANLGDLDSGKSKLFWQIIYGNLSVVQCQAIVVGILAATVAILLDLVTEGKWAGIDHALLMAAGAVSAASLASLILAVIMIAIVLLARRCGVNPDNVASPIAGMLGDFCTLALLSGIATLLWDDANIAAMATVLIIYGLVAPLFAWLSCSNPYTTSVLREGWMPTIASMLISTCAGLILKHAVTAYHQLAPFAPVMNGAGGNLAAVHASRLSTEFHITRRSPAKDFVAGRPLLKECDTPKRKVCSALCGSDQQSRTARTLAMLALPGSVCFASIIVGVRSKWQGVPCPAFLLAFLTAALFQVCTLLVLAHGLVAKLWSMGLDPDNCAIPYVTAVGDVVGTASLSSAFVLLHEFGNAVWVGGPPA